MKVYLSRRYRFSASHRLHSDELCSKSNQDTYGKCNNPFGHGHNYMVEVTFSGPLKEATGMVANLADLDSFARERLLDFFDHQNLNTLDFFDDLVPTTENLTVVFHRIFSFFPGAKLEKVRVEETSNNSFEFGTRAGLD